MKSIEQYCENCRLPAIAALLISATSIHGQDEFIMHGRFTTANPDPIFPWDFEGRRLVSLSSARFFPVDMNGDGTTDYTFKSGNISAGGFSLIGEGQNAVLASQNSPLASTLAIPLPAGTTLDSSANSASWIIADRSGPGVIGALLTGCSDIGCSGLFTGVESGYIGVQFDIAGQSHYGWFRAGAPLAVNGGWIYEYAYETRPGVPILTGAVPEPSTWALLAVGTGVFWRVRRRKVL